MSGILRTVLPKSGFRRHFVFGFAELGLTPGHFVFGFAEVGLDAAAF